MSEELFDVVQFFVDDSYERVLENVGAERAVKMMKQLSESVGGRIGTTKRIIVTDKGDCTVAEWIHGKGITWPVQGEPGDVP